MQGILRPRKVITLILDNTSSVLSVVTDKIKFSY